MSSLFTLWYIWKHCILFIAYIKNQTFPPPLSKEKEQHYLALLENDDKEARDILIEHNLRLVAHIVKKFENTKEDTEDLISIGTIGLIKGIESYSSGKGTKLATYAARCIENEILMHLRSKKKTRKDISLQDPIGHDKEGNELQLMDILEADTEDITEQIQRMMDIEDMQKYLTLLTAREKEIIVHRYGLNNSKEHTQKDIASKLNISRSYVSRIEKRALLKIFQEFYKRTKK
ncbi:RNA polymerase sporulation sigma factor SigK [Salimicrobium halophilum]|uniref:RNA polymerase sigma factor n=1 Tax=Salimicrobium halophilum TaxID=86666 RepID=A0A1G8PNC8_9BACI|nr:RNA polymerase sporulation sigma factor SigK [Salimicrobium halophilum]SDI93816.1 RNA polymerase sporulation-specific sigma factor [Salimicrobium halophilum]